MPSTWILGINNLDMGIFWACAPSAPMLISAPFPRDWSQHQLGPMLHLKLSAIAKINAHEGRDGGGENAGNGVRKLLIQKRWNQGGKLMKQPVIDLELRPIDGDKCQVQHSIVNYKWRDWIEFDWNQGGRWVEYWPAPMIDLELTPIDGDRCLEDESIPRSDQRNDSIVNHKWRDLIEFDRNQGGKWVKHQPIGGILAGGDDWPWIYAHRWRSLSAYPHLPLCLLLSRPGRSDRHSNQQIDDIFRQRLTMTSIRLNRMWLKSTTRRYHTPISGQIKSQLRPMGKIFTIWLVINKSRMDLFRLWNGVW